MLLIEAKWILVRPLPGHDSTRSRMEDTRSLYGGYTRILGTHRASFRLVHSTD